ncbi:unnamed protein product [Polarella glacialis]|uniref:Uncharacterized protein n=1 Tax=Polarella glacialis TaxID=89957 RepID=A0A813FSH2_POLGL|nr:unnamed protein product [Polarella glacialis]CAE8722163.1 unnamed protein product [Polarella glacialis]
MGFLTAHAYGQFFCPPTVPVAIQPTPKAGSRSLGVWAAQIEGLMPGLVAARRAITSLLQAGGENPSYERYTKEWLEHEMLRLQCSFEAWEASANAVMGKYLADDWPTLGVPLELCPTVCQRGIARLRVVMLRSPFARLASYYRFDWRKRRGDVALGATFDHWIEVALGPETNESLLDAYDALHIRPVFDRPHLSSEVIFLVEDPVGSIRRVEDALCAEPFRYCNPLPPFPAGIAGARNRASQVEWTDRARQLVESRYQHDLAAQEAAVRRA